MDNYNTDEHGFLLDFASWDMDFCNLVAAQENISLTQEHIFIIEFLRHFYQQTSKSPAIRELVKALKEKYGEKIGNSLYLQTLFPVSPAVQAAKLAGLPKPKRCI
ncbi:TusE/DsrC/DsvC family sulfur relay protein [Francisella tularensis]|uniref:Sulfurtransferase n=2 Tax=Francisella tularensis subsp. holarctica TaxID=119857 RepID=A0AAI8BH69_FRATH|nr:TusE/DsrC/DsvC family sulfur relay protein [Francisella tularensis]AFX71227.1 DsrC (dissimilatory sulfite reductase)-like protein [Francisella tularensis subsp. holarctica F92]AHH46887.1 sulfurtransferase [Francisella tularensis subsp. holarctica PHIT-FT049]ABI83349.1 dissimilatory sulfite reductase subunit gamma [Francisella tularensis subsp. holarctica OSU18]ABU62168.2 DsrC (dissimilatory sulfite reductase)-like protein [Francisella tularensis subsp. holarctica FTNF002-00]AFT93232.1 hypot